jgi:glycine/D-amino acid oxidase-like deaminating enzyme
MKRDGNSESLWQNTAIEFPIKSNSPAGEQLFDVIIAGGGITGITTGLLLQKSGKSVLIAEAQTIGFGTTGGTTAHLNTFLDTPYHVIQKKFSKEDARLVAKAVGHSLQLIKNNVDEYNMVCGYSQLPAYLFSQDEKQTKELEDIIKGTRESGVLCEWTDSIPVPLHFEKALQFPGQASFHPLRYLLALADAFQKAGGVIIEDCRITGLDEGDPNIVKSNHGNFKAIHFIYATHIPPGVNLLHF